MHKDSALFIMRESIRIEFKRELTKELDIEREVIAFLNYREVVLSILASMIVVKMLKYKI